MRSVTFGRSTFLPLTFTRLHDVSRNPPSRIFYFALEMGIPRVLNPYEPLLGIEDR